MSPTNPRIIINGLSRMNALAKDAIQEINPPLNITFETTDFLVQKLIHDPKGLKKELDKFGPHYVLVSGDRYALYIRERFNIPVVPIKVTGFELMQALIDARQYDSEVVLANFNRTMPEVEKCQSILKVRVRQFAYSNQKEAHQLFKKLKKEGCKVIIGSSVTCNFAEEYGMKGIFYYTRSAMKEALNYAIDIITTYQQEMERAEKFKAIVDFTYSGIIATDSNFRITTFNPAAERILGLKSEEVIKRPFANFFPEFKVIHKEGEMIPKINTLGGYGSTRVVFSSLPILVDGRACGQVTVLTDTATIQMVEEKIRRETHNRRFTAQHNFSDIAGKSHILRNAVDKATRYGRTESAVHITGETGTGKELFAQSIHNISNRWDKPFVAVNCAALPESLLDSELFGYEQGAFTGARKGGKPGLFEMAHTGTIFLDEVGEISPAVQGRLLRVLQEKEVMRLGGDRLIPIDVRVISATNRNLRELVHSGKFREDLYYRLNILELQIPPLRERKEDIPELIRSILQQIAPQILHPSDSLVIKAFTELKDYSWRGNVRELENILERFAALAIEARPDLKIFKQILRECCRNVLLENKTLQREKLGLQLKVRETEENEIERVLEDLGGNKTRAARALGISRSTLYRKYNK